MEILFGWHKYNFDKNIYTHTKYEDKAKHIQLDTHTIVLNVCNIVSGNNFFENFW